MSHLLDRLRFFEKVKETFSNGHGLVTNEDRKWGYAYRHRWQHDKIVRSTHGVNCTGGCSWKIFVKNGLVAFEMQQTDYPRTREDLPNHEPRGCQRGASFSWYLYSPHRIKHPLAAKLTKSKKIGVTGPVEVGDAKTCIDGFTQGVAATDPSVQLSKTWTDSFSDVAMMTEAAKAHIASGADVLTGSSQSVVGSIGSAKDAGNVLWFGTQSDQSSLAPGSVVASQVYKWEVVLKQIIDLVKAGTLGGQSFEIDLANKGEIIGYNSGYSLPDDVKQAAEAAIKGIVDGTIRSVPAHLRCRPR